MDAVQGFMLLHHGNVAAEGWWSPYRPQFPHPLFSLSKSFTSTAIGVAVEEGLLTVHDPVFKFFPDWRFRIAAKPPRWLPRRKRCQFKGLICAQP
jgi:CubicO group peptidase (beta-lactamase class C family)